jgi:hypothetical protein
MDKRTNLEIYLTTFFHNMEVIKLLNKPDEWIFKQQIRVSDTIKILKSKWDWSIRDNFDSVENFYQMPYYYEYLILSSYENKAAEYPLKIDGLVLHRFDQVNTINQALIEIKKFCQSQPPSAIEEFTKNTGSKNVQDFIARLDFLITHKVKQLIYDGILEILPEC